MECKDCGGVPCPTCGVCDTIISDCTTNKWVNCKDALPTKKGKILVLINGELVPGEVIEKEYGCSVYIGEFCYYELGGYAGWLEQAIECAGRWILPTKWREPTHWLAIPDLDNVAVK